MFAALTITALLIGCGNRMDTAPLFASAIVIATPNGSVPVTGTMQFVATVTDASGNEIALAPVWTVVNGGGTITSGGLFTAGDSAATFINTITATIGAVSTTSSVTVSAGALVAIVISPETLSIASRATQRFVAVGKDAQGNVVALSAPVTWTVGEGGGTIDSEGMFTSGSLAGTFAKTVIATSGTLADSATVVVQTGAIVAITIDPDFAKMGVGDSTQFRALGRDANGNQFVITPVWSVVSRGGTITSTGFFRAGTAPGFYGNTVRATIGAVSGSATVYEFPGSTVKIVVTPDSATVAGNTTQQFTAVGLDSFGNSTKPDLTWTVSHGGGSIDGDGLLTADSVAGRYTVTARITDGTLSGSGTVIVTTPVNPLVSIVITPANPTISDCVNSPFQFTATGYDTDGNVVPILPAPVWNVAPQVGTFDFNGLMTANPDANGFFQNAISATSGTIVGTTSVTMGSGC